MNKENDWDYIAEANMVVGPIVKITLEKVVIPIKPMDQERLLDLMKHVQK